MGFRPERTSLTVTGPENLSWTNVPPDEDWFTGYPQEIEAFYRTVAYGEPVESDSRLAADSISTIYSAYVSAEKKGAEMPVRTF